MTLLPGTRLGPYEILSPLGAGGMGEVYRARDTRLNRDVALKVLPAPVAADAERMARFEREAQVLASLNHPNIASIYGLEESGGMRALVMELVEGPTLAERLKSGAIPLDDALPIARQVAEALEAAHEHGVIHRDLKPANIKITPEGTVKVLDFGLAKALPVAPSDVGGVREKPLQDSPTLSAMATQAGVILGTAAYMSPEQAKGKSVDRRADIWAFGCVLYEMLAGEQAFKGETVPDTLAAVLKTEPHLNAIATTTPARVQNLLRRCLEKDPKRRLQAIGEARIALEETPSGAPDIGAIHEWPLQAVPAVGISPLQPWRRLLPWALAAAGILGCGVLAIVARRYARQPKEEGAIRFSVSPPEGTSFTEFSLSPDGRRLAFTTASSGSGSNVLWVRSLDDLTAKPLPGTEQARLPFWSPDGDYLGFFAGLNLKKIEVSGGPPVGVCDASLGQGGSWAPDGTILFAPNSTSPLYRVSAGGGQPVAVTTLDPSRREASHYFPQFLPDKRHFLYDVDSESADFSGTYVGSLEGGKPKLLLRGSSHGVYAPPGYLLFVHDGTLMAQRFDLGRLELSGDPVPIAQSAGAMQSSLRAMVTASRNGILAYGTGASAAGWQLEWFDRDGKPAGTIGGSQIFFTPRLSPSGKELAVAIGRGASPTRDIWVFDRARGVETRLTFNPFHNWTPVWSPDGTRLAFSSNPKGRFHIYEKAANGTGTTQPLLEDNATEYVDSWSSDGMYIAYGREDPQGKPGWDIWILPLFGDMKPFPLLQSQFNKEDPSFSSDGKWLAYDSDESGRWEVYIVPFPQGNGKWQVSTGGGSQPRWRRDGKELFYLSAENRLMATEVQEKNGSLKIGNPQALFRTHAARSAFRTYDVTADGKQFVVITQPTQSSAEPLTLVVNWPALMKKP